MAKKAQSEQLRTTVKKEVFLEALLEHGSISAASTALKMSRTSVYEWKERDPGFAEDVENTLRKSLRDRLFEATKSKLNPAPLIFMGKAILGLSDNASETVQLRKQLNETMRELEALRLAVYHATRSNPELQSAIFDAVEKRTSKAN
jgi:hypothetical protein